MDEYLQLTLGEGDDEEMITVILPENYPRGVYKVTLFVFDLSGSFFARFSIARACERLVVVS